MSDASAGDDFVFAIGAIDLETDFSPVSAVARARRKPGSSPFEDVAISVSSVAGGTELIPLRLSEIREPRNLLSSPRGT